MLRSAPIELESLVLTHDINSLVAPARRAAQTKMTVRGKTSSLADVIPNDSQMLLTNALLKTFSGAVSIPMNGSTDPRLITSDSALATIRTNNSPSCR
jgi:hypothetical protein